MKILVISNYTSIVTTRPEAEIFIGLVEKGHDVTVMTYPNAEYTQRFEAVGIKVIPFHPSKKRDKASIAFIREELIKGDYDILQMYNSLAYLNGIPAAKGLSVKVVLYRGYTGNIHWYDPFIYLKYYNRRVDGVVCNVEAIQKLFEKNYFGSRIKFQAIHKGHDTSWYEVDKAVDLSEFGVKDGDISFICTANDRKMKGLKYLLEATKELSADAHFHLFLVGNNMDRPEFLQLITDSPVREKIHILGFRKDILEVEKSCDVFVLASLYGEAITKAVIESMSLGLAPLITDIPGNKPLVINGESGVVVAPGSAESMANGIKTYLENPELIAKYGAAAKNRIQNTLNTKNTVQEYEKFYQKLLQS